MLKTFQTQFGLSHRIRSRNQGSWTAPQTA